MATVEAIEYPSSDGKPMADNTVQFDWIQKLVHGLRYLFKDDPHVFIAGDLLWYPVEGNNKTRQAPDAMVVFGRPKGDRGSYMQWLEVNVPPQVVFEVLSPSNRASEMKRKWKFYEKFGVEEYYVYDPDRVILNVHLRNGSGKLVAINNVERFVSPRLGTRFDTTGEEMVVYQPDGTPLMDMYGMIERMKQETRRANVESARADQAAAKAEDETEKAKKEAARAEQEAVKATQAQAEIERLRQKLRDAGLSE